MSHLDLIRPPARIAFIDLGVMGAAMAANMRRAGFALAVHNSRHAKAAALEEAGATWVPSPAEATRGAACICLCLPDASDVEAVLFGPDGVAESIGTGAVVVDFSTVAAAPTAAFARRLIEERGAFLLDSPVSGGPSGAHDGTLTCMVGGDAAAFAAAEPVLRAIGRTLTHLGPAGCRADLQVGQPVHHLGEGAGGGRGACAGPQGGAGSGGHA